MFASTCFYFVEFIFFSVFVLMQRLFLVAHSFCSYIYRGHLLHRLPLPPQIDVLQAEVQALKTLVLSSPTSPVGELPPAGGGVKTPFRKGHSRNKSTSSAIMGTQPDPTATQPIVRECREVK